MADRKAPKSTITTAGYAVKLKLAALAVLWERLWPAAWPAAGVLALFVALALLDVLPHLPAWLHLATLIGFAAAFAYLAWRGVRGFVAPDRDDARRRLETASGLEHRPLTVLEDDLATNAEDDQSVALWRLHQKRMAELARRLRVGIPAPGLARLDPNSLRGALLLVLVVAAVAAWPAPGERMLRALTPQFGGGKADVAGVFDLWIAPPDYTAMAPIFPLKMKKPEAAGEDGPKVPRLDVPQGSKVISQVQGRGGVPKLVLGDTTQDFERVDPLHSRIEAALETGGRLAVERGSEVLGEWRVRIVPDTAPEVSFAEPPSPTPRGALRLSFVARDDYGLTSAKAVFRRTYEKGEVIGKQTDEITLNLPAENAKQARETGFYDLTPHRWAGMPVAMELFVTDALGQTGKSERLKFVLPERTFNHPVARAIIEQRKRLTERPEKRKRVIMGLERIASNPAAFADDVVVFLALSSARSRLYQAPDEEAIDSVRDLLWDTALRLEDGSLSIAERELRRAQQALMDALSRKDASDAELERLMRELQAALNRYMRALAEQMRNMPADQQQVIEMDPNMMLMQGSDLQRMLDQIRNMIRSGARQAAREMLARLQNMLENMRAANMVRMRMQGMQGAGTMRKLQDLIRRQQQLMDRTFRQSRPGQGQPRFGPEGAARQRALREALRALRGMMPQQGGQGPGQFLDQAGQAMERAIRELEQNQPGNAIGPQGEALDRLQRAGRGLMQQMMDRFARRSGQGRGRQPMQSRPRRDPLGREIGDDLDSSDVQIPDASDVQRAQDILDELRRRAGEINRPRFELDYIDRLLRRF